MSRTIFKASQLWLRLCLIVSLVIPAVTLAVPDQASAAAQQPIRVLQYNVQGITALFLGEEYDMSQYDRGQLIGDKILAGDYDVVTINELFDGDMKDGITDKLKPTYPFALTDIGSTYPVKPGNSGLAVYSKLAPAPRNDLSNIFVKTVQIKRDCSPPDSECAPVYDSVDLMVDDLYCGGVDIVEGYGFDNNCSNGFMPYEDLYHDDSFSVKGVAWVRLLDPSGTPVNVFFSHAQASYSIPDPDAEKGRISNFKQINDFIKFVVPPAGRKNEAILLTGDLNVIGGTSEYDNLIGANSELYDLGLRDIWSEYNSGKDPGYTRGLNNTHVLVDDEFKMNQRLDYMIGKYPRGCFMHSTVKRDFVDSKGRDLSDHYGIDTVIGTSASFCSPSIASEQPDGVNKYNIASPGDYQWVYFPKAGTYTFKAYATDIPKTSLELTAYAEDELSFPVKPWEGNAVINNRQETVTYTPPGAFYLRIRAVESNGTPNETWQGDFHLNIHKAAGATWEDAIVLHPNQRMNADMAADNGIQSLQTETFFKFKTELSDNGAMPWSTFDLEQKVKTGETYDDPSPKAPTIRFGFAIRKDKNGQNLFARPSSAKHSGFHTKFGTTMQTLPEGEYRLVVSRPQPSTNQSAAFSVNFETNLRVLDIAELYCIEQEDFTGDDDPYLELTLDGTFTSTFLYPDADSDQGHHNPMAITGVAIDPHRIMIIQDAAIKLMEVDDIDDDDYIDTANVEISPDDDGSMNLGFLQGDGAEYILKYTVAQPY